MSEQDHDIARDTGDIEKQESIPAVLARLAALERRVLSLEGRIYHNGGLSSGVRRVVGSWPGPFTAELIRRAVYELHPELKPVTEEHQVSCLLTRMEKAGEIICTSRGAGPTPNIYIRASRPPASAGRSGGKFGTRHDGESGFRGIVRQAMDDLPKAFTLIELRAWVAKHAPSAVVPDGTWSSTLYKMTQQQELVVISPQSKVDGHRRRVKVYGRGPRRIGLTGDEIGELEAAWKAFRAENPVKSAESLTPLERGNYD